MIPALKIGVVGTHWRFRPKNIEASLKERPVQTMGRSVDETT